MVNIANSRLAGALLDTHTTPPQCPKPSIPVLIARTARYRFAGAGSPLTENERKIVSFRNKHQGQRCFIIGGGPSLNQQDLTLLKNEHTFGVNAIYTNHANMGFYPSYFVVEDVFVAEDRASEINNYQHGTKFFGNYFRYCLNEDSHTVWLNVIFRFDNYPGFPHFSTNSARRIWVGGTVTYLCMQLAYYMGFSEVYLIGFDHSYDVPASAIVNGNDITSTTDDTNHFNKEYFGKGKRWHDPKLDRMELAYKHAREHFDADNRRIYNATLGGNLDVFERIDYNSLF